MRDLVRFVLCAALYVIAVAVRLSGRIGIGGAASIALLATALVLWAQLSYFFGPQPTGLIDGKDTRVWYLISALSVGTTAAIILLLLG